MINFFVENDFEWPSSKAKTYRRWLDTVIESEGFAAGEINFIFCDDDYLHKMNVNYLGHDDYTDIITFDNSTGKLIEADIFISSERVVENAHEFEVEDSQELQRVLAHGLLHCMDFDDKTEDQRSVMRDKELEKIKMFHVEH